MKKNLKSVISFVIALALTAGSTGAFAAASYTDVPADASYAEAVNNLTAIGIVEGDGDGTFRPDDKITRAEVAAMVVRAMAQNDAAISSKGATNFTDVAADNWASGYINVASRGSTAFINGMGDGTFAPQANVTYAQIVKMVVAAIGYGDWGIAAGGYPTGYIATAKQIGITDGITGVNAEDEVSRAVVAQLINNAIDTPLLALKTYSPTNPEYVVMDGTDDNDYETVLTYYHNIYKVEGRVTQTSKTTSGSLDSDEIRYRIELTKNYDDGLVVKKNNDDYPAETYKMNTGDTDVADYLNVYSKLMVKVEDDEDPVVLSCIASAKNTQVTLQADAWDDEYYDVDDDETDFDKKYEKALDAVSRSASKPQMWYYSNSSKTGKSSRYYLAEDYTLYVNGVEIDDATEEDIAKYVFDNENGTITLVDTPDMDSNSTDGKYDAIFVSYYATAIVESTNSNGKVYFANSDIKTLMGDNTTYIEFDDDDEDKTYDIALNGEEITWSDLQEDDVISIAFDPTVRNFTDSDFYEILVSRDTAEGKVTETNDEDEEIGVDGKTYKLTNLVDIDDDNFKLGTSYTLYLDAFGKIADYEKLSSTVKYGIVSRLFWSEEADEYKLNMYDTTGTSKTFTLAETVKIDNTSYDTTEEGKLSEYELTAKVNSSNFASDDRVVEYTTNASGDVKTITFLSAKESGSNVDYTEKSNKIGSVKFDDASVIINIDGSDVSLVKSSALVDDADYTVYGYDKEDGVCGFIVITDGIGSYNNDTRFAVVNKITQGTDDEGNDCDKLQLYTADSKEIVTVYTDGVNMFYGSSASKSLEKGDVIIYETNANGVIDDSDDVQVIFSVDAGMLEDNGYIAKADDTWYQGTNIITTPSKWTVGGNDDDVEVRFGPIIDKSTSSITLGKVEDVDGKTVTNIENTDDLDYADDVAVYVYDANENTNNRVSLGTVGSVTKTTVSKTLRLALNDEGELESDKNGDYFDWNDIDDTEFAFGLVKMVEDEVTDVYVLIPKDNK